MSAPNADTGIAAMLAIGDELLSGRTKDRNIAYLADYLTALGIDLKEVRIVGDEQQQIVAAVNALRATHDYVFTSGGIGPTHDDITADAIGDAFGVPVEHDPATLEMMGAHYAGRGIEFTEARKRMARFPQGATPIDNPVSKAPGFKIGNVHVMAGVPSIFQAMLESIAPTLKTGMKTISRHVDCPFPEGTIGELLTVIAQENRDVAIGSYPRFDGKTFSVQIVVRGRDEAKIDAAVEAVEAMVAQLSTAEGSAFAKRV